MRPVLAVCRTLAILLLVACSPRPAALTGDAAAGAPRIPRDAARFEIDAVDDSTAVIRLEEAQWVRRGLPAYAVDPQRRDALVARLTVLSRDATTARVLVTSQVTRVTTEHFLLLPRPSQPWWKRRVVWLSALSGAVVGAGTTMALR